VHRAYAMCCRAAPSPDARATSSVRHCPVNVIAGVLARVAAALAEPTVEASASHLVSRRRRGRSSKTLPDLWCARWTRRAPERNRDRVNRTQRRTGRPCRVKSEDLAGATQRRGRRQPYLLASSNGPDAGRRPGFSETATGQGRSRNWHTHYPLAVDYEFDRVCVGDVRPVDIGRKAYRRRSSGGSPGASESCPV
jgi:hypothetical protein